MAAQDEGSPARVEFNPNGLYCPAGDFYIDPTHPVRRALITHGHGDHVRPGCGSYLCSDSSVELLKHRLGKGALVQGIPFGEVFEIGGARLSFHPAGHILGSAQVRIEAGGEVWVVSGDFKREPDPTCEAFEVVRCDTFVTESTFALPIFQWPDPKQVAREIHDWWEEGRAEGRPSILFAYALGKSQRVMAELKALTSEPVLLHDSATALTDIYRSRGVSMLPFETVPLAARSRPAEYYAGRLILAPPSTFGPGWFRRCGESTRTAHASGWVQSRNEQRKKERPLFTRVFRNARAKREYDRGFILSDHADWPGLLRTIEETGARRVRFMHGRGETLSRHLRDQGMDCAPL